MAGRHSARGRLAVGLGLLAAYATTLGLPGGLLGDGPDRAALEAAWLGGHEDLRAAPGLGLSALLGPLDALGPTVASLVLAALLALAFVCARELAADLVGDPWATAGTLAVGLSPPVVAASTTVAPAAPAALLLAGGALLALRARERPRLAVGLPGATLLALVPWLQTLLALPALCVAVALQRRLRRGRGRLAALLALEVVVFSAVLLVTVSDRLLDRLAPREAQLGDAAGVPLRLLGTLLDPADGLLRWAPVLLLVALPVTQAVRVRRERLDRALDALAHRAAAVALLGSAVLAGLLAAALAPALAGAALVPGAVVAVLPLAAPLVALGLRQAPRSGGALAAITVLGSASLVVAGRLG